MTNAPPLLTAQDVADRMNVSVRTVRRWAINGEVPAVRVGRTVRFHPGAIDALIEAGAA